MTNYLDNIKSLNLIFENLESVEIPRKYINYLITDGYSKNIISAVNAITFIEQYKSIKLNISKDLDNNKELDFKLDDIAGRYDITYFELVFNENDNAFRFYAYYDEDLHYDNVNQVNSLDDNGNLLITIEK